LINHFLISNFKILVNACHLLLFFNVVLFFIGFSRNGKAYKIFTLYLLVIFIGEMISKIMIYNKYENICMSHYYFIMQFIFLSLFYYQILIVEKQKLILKLFLFLIPLSLIFQLLISPRLIFVFSLFEVFICSFSIIIYSSLHFYNMLIEKRIFYFINSGIFIYLIGSTVIFLAGNVILMKKNHVGEILSFTNVVLYIFYLIMILIEWIKNYSNLNKFSKNLKP
jgi:hypothetical protein